MISRFRYYLLHFTGICGMPIVQLHTPPFHFCESSQFSSARTVFTQTFLLLNMKDDSQPDRSRTVFTAAKLPYLDFINTANSSCQSQHNFDTSLLTHCTIFFNNASYSQGDQHQASTSSLTADSFWTEGPRSRFTVTTTNMKSLPQFNCSRIIPGPLLCGSPNAAEKSTQFTYNVLLFGPWQWTPGFSQIAMLCRFRPPSWASISLQYHVWLSRIYSHLEERGFVTYQCTICAIGPYWATVSAI